MDEQEIKDALGKIEDRITTLEIVRKYHEPTQRTFSAWSFLEQNAEIIAAIAIFIAINLVVWEKLSYAN